MFGISAGEIIFIAIVALILFGNENLPTNLKKLLQGLQQGKKVLHEAQNSWQDLKLDLKKSVAPSEPVAVSPPAQANVYSGNEEAKTASSGDSGAPAAGLNAKESKL